MKTLLEWEALTDEVCLDLPASALDALLPVFSAPPPAAPHHVHHKPSECSGMLTSSTARGSLHSSGTAASGSLMSRSGPTSAAPASAQEQHWSSVFDDEDDDTEHMEYVPFFASFTSTTQAQPQQMQVKQEELMPQGAAERVSVQQHSAMLAPNSAVTAGSNISSSFALLPSPPVQMQMQAHAHAQYQQPPLQQQQAMGHQPLLVAMGVQPVPQAYLMQQPQQLPMPHAGGAAGVGLASAAAAAGIMVAAPMAVAPQPTLGVQWSAAHATAMQQEHHQQQHAQQLLPPQVQQRQEPLLPVSVSRLALADRAGSIGSSSLSAFGEGGQGGGSGSAVCSPMIHAPAGHQLQQHQGSGTVGGTLQASAARPLSPGGLSPLPARGTHTEARVSRRAGRSASPTLGVAAAKPKASAGAPRAKAKKKHSSVRARERLATLGQQSAEQTACCRQLAAQNAAMRMRLVRLEAAVACADQRLGLLAGLRAVGTLRRPALEELLEAHLAQVLTLA